MTWLLGWLKFLVLRARLGRSIKCCSFIDIYINHIKMISKKGQDSLLLAWRFLGERLNFSALA